MRHWLLILHLLLVDLIDLLFLAHGVEHVILIDELLADLSELSQRNLAIAIAVGYTQKGVNLEWGQIEGLASIESSLGLQDCDLARVICVLMQELLDNISFDFGHVALHHFADSNLIPHVVEHVWELRVLDPVILLQPDEQVLLFGRQEFGAPDDILEVLERDNTISDDVDLLKEVGEELIAFLNLIPIDQLESIWIWMLHLLSLLLGNVPRVESLDGVDSDWDELLPRDQFVLVLIGQSDQHVDVVIV
jgi:hypothetical protein